MCSDLSWYCTFVWCRSWGSQRSEAARAVPPPTPQALPTLRMASGKFLLKNRTTSFTFWLLLVLTVIM